MNAPPVGSVSTTTKTTNRKDLAVALGNVFSVVKQFESLTTDVTQNLPDGINSLATLVAALQQVAFVLVGASDLAPAGRVLTQGAGITIQAEAGAITVSLIIPVPIDDGGTGATNAKDARVNLGLGTMATQNAGAVTITGGSVDGTDVGDVAPAKGAFSKLSNGEAVLMHSTVALSNGSGAAAGTLANAPVAGNPTKWIAIDDNGTTRYIPAW